LKSKPALILFIKNPVKGRVKTRLAKKLGDEQALAVYLLLLQHTRAAAIQTDAARIIAYSDFIPESDEWDPALFLKSLQSGQDLGQRMFQALASALESHPATILAGGDIPQLSPEILTEGIRQLQRHDLVIGPASDGGYYLIGMKRPEPRLFEGIAWSTPSVFQQTLAKARALRLSAHILPTLHDVDEAEDWEKVKHLFEV
jgi:rSAM/selenodomain-associated transferase 1